MQSRVAMIAGVTMLMTARCASTLMAPPNADLSGKWAGDWIYQPSTISAGTLSGTIQQDGNKLSGNFLIMGGGNAARKPSATIIGFISGNQCPCPSHLLGP